MILALTGESLEQQHRSLMPLRGLKCCGHQAFSRALDELTDVVVVLCLWVSVVGGGGLQLYRYTFSLVKGVHISIRPGGWQLIKQAVFWYSLIHSTVGCQPLGFIIFEAAALQHEYPGPGSIPHYYPPTCRKAAGLTKCEYQIVQCWGCQCQCQPKEKKFTPFSRVCDLEILCLKIGKPLKLELQRNINVDARKINSWLIFQDTAFRQ